MKSSAPSARAPAAMPGPPTRQPRWGAVGPRRQWKKVGPEPMPLTPGARLGPYQIVDAIGAGGMGEVYRARDTKLGRDVALKILPDAFAADPDRLARFQREAKTLASLNHPNIGTLHGLEESDGITALVME